MPRSVVSFLILFSLTTALAVDLAPLTLREPHTPVPEIRDLTWFGDHFVAVGLDEWRGNVFHTVTGEAWTFSRCNTSNLLYAVAAGGGLLVSVGSSGAICTSSDGSTWTTQHSGVTNTLTAISFGAGQFVAIGSASPDGMVLTSSNGVAWTAYRLPGILPTDVAYGNGLWAMTVLTANERARFLISTNAIDWELRELQVEPSNNFLAITYGASGFVAAGYRQMAFSSNGQSWSPFSVAGPQSIQWTSISWSGTKYIAAGRSSFPAFGAITTSADGTNWTAPTVFTPQSQSWRGFHVVAASGTTAIALGGRGVVVRSTSDGESWVSDREALPAQLNAVTHGAGQFVVVGDPNQPGFAGPGMVRFSSDGIRWSTTFLEFSAFKEPDLHDVIYVNGAFVGVGGRDGGDAQRSTDGINWTHVTNICCGFASVAHGPQGFVAVGSSWLAGIASLATSIDGLTWVERSSALTNTPLKSRFLKGVAYGNGIYMAVGMARFAATSPDTTNWTPGSIFGTSATDNFNAILYTNGGFHVVGDNGLLLRQASFPPWERISTGYTNSFHSLVYANGTYVVVGSDGLILTSTNGTTWTRVESGVQVTLRDVTYGNGTFVIVGDRGVILQSRDFLRPRLRMLSGPAGIGLVAPVTEFGRPYRVLASTVPHFASPEVILTYSNVHSEIVVSFSTGRNGSNLILPPKRFTSW